MPRTRALAGFVVACCTFILSVLLVDSASWQPSLADVSPIEARLKMPSGAHPLIAYARYYTGEMTDGHRQVRGLYLFGLGDAPGVYLKQGDVITVSDGGCSNVHVLYDVDAARLVDLRCGGR